jgi:hypothetical protein
MKGWAPYADSGILVDVERAFIITSKKYDGGDVTFYELHRRIEREIGNEKSLGPLDLGPWDVAHLKD